MLSNLNESLNRKQHLNEIKHGKLCFPCGWFHTSFNINCRPVANQCISHYHLYLTHNNMHPRGSLHLWSHSSTNNSKYYQLSNSDRRLKRWNDLPRSSDCLVNFLRDLCLYCNWHGLSVQEEPYSPPTRERKSFKTRETRSRKEESTYRAQPSVIEKWRRQQEVKSKRSFIHGRRFHDRQWCLGRRWPASCLRYWWNDQEISATAWS